MGRFLTAMLLAALLAPFDVLALRSGDKAVNVQVQYLLGKPVTLVPYAVNKANRDKLQVAVFFNVWTPGCKEAVPVLNSLAETYRSKVKFAIISGEDTREVQNFIRDNPSLQIPMAADPRRRAVNQYMSGSLLYPRAFVIDYEGKILWDGEVVDLPEMLGNFYGGTFRAADQPKISKGLDELQTALRSADENRAAAAVKTILKIDPANSAALRMRLFMLESTGRQQEAWNLVQRQLTAHPQEKKLYLIALDLASRYPEFEKEAAPLARRMLEKAGLQDEEKALGAWNLMTRFPFNPETLAAAGALLETAGGSSPVAGVSAARALYRYRLGDVAGAISEQEKAVSQSPASEKAAAGRLLDYYSQVKKLAK